MSTSQINNQRIAKNTILLYARTLFVMLISLYTSRVILQALGVEDYGVYQVVGGMVAMFSIISAALSTSIGRFITFELGTGNTEKLKQIFATSIVIQIIISIIVFVLAEVVGLWFMNTKMQIPDGRSTAAFWVLQCSIISFIISLLSVPYNACIIAHEHMKAFAYVSVLEAVAKLLICYLIVISPIDRLISYAILLALVAILIRLTYTIYCKKRFEECSAPVSFHHNIFKEMFGFAGWSFFTNTNSILNNQGVNMLINVYFGVTFNAARAIANQVESATLQFVNNFTMAVNPQITKSYAARDMEGMYSLVCRGSKFAYFLMLMMSLPLISEADTILHIWLVEVPEQTVIFVQLSLVLGLIDSLGTAGYTACMATGHLRKYALIIGFIGLFEFPLSWIFFSLGAAIVSSYYIYIVVKMTVCMARMYLLKDMVGMPMRMYLLNVIGPVTIVTLLAAIPSVIISCLLPQNYIRLILSLIIGLASVSVATLLAGMTKEERTVVLSRISRKIRTLKS